MYKYGLGKGETRATPKVFCFCKPAGGLQTGSATAEMQEKIYHPILKTI
jgi:hypothetical protein